MSGVSGGTADFLNTYTYNSLDEMSGVSQTDQSATASTYNGVTAKNVTFSFDSANRLSGSNYYQSAGTTSSVAAAAYNYDNDSNLTDLAYTKSTSTLAAYHWDYDADSRVSHEYSLNDTTSGASISDYTTWAETSYGYDHTSQLTSTSYSSDFANAPTANLSESFDSNGNRTATDSTTSSSSTDRLLNDGTYTYTYDAAGNRLTRTKISDGTVTAYGWNNANQLISVKTYSSWSDYTSGATPTSEVDYGYDPFGDMVSRIVKNSSGTVTSNENFIYDGQSVALVLNGSGQVTQRNLYGAAVDQILASEAVAPVDSGAQAAGTIAWMFTDNQGTVRDVGQYNSGTSATSIVDHVILNSFGAITGQVASGTYTSGPPTSGALIFGMNGTLYDPVTGLNLMGARWYDPANGVWISQDPIGFNDGGTNLAMYCSNSSVNFTDPSGELFVLDGLGAAAGGALLGGAIGGLGYLVTTSITGQQTTPGGFWGAVANGAVTGGIIGAAATGDPLTAIAIAGAAGYVGGAAGSIVQQAWDNNGNVNFGDVAVAAAWGGVGGLAGGAFGAGLSALVTKSGIDILLSQNLTRITAFASGPSFSFSLSLSLAATEAETVAAAQVGGILGGAFSGGIGVAMSASSSGDRIPVGPPKGGNGGVRGIDGGRPATPEELANPSSGQRTPEQNRIARNKFKNNKQAARDAYEQRTGSEWPTDENGNPWPAEHTPPLKHGGDPMTVTPRDPAGVDPHNIPGPDGLTDYQRWGALGTPARQAKKAALP